MPVRYSGPDGPKELIPAPFCEVSKSYIKDEGGRVLRPEYVFTLFGTIVNVDTSLDSPGSIGIIGMEGILAEESRIRRLFSQPGGRLEIESPSGGGPNTIDAYCTVESINFDRGTWVNKATYTIVLKTGVLTNDTEAYTNLNSTSENWNFTENEDGSYSISHSLSAVGHLQYSDTGANNPLLEAKVWCNARKTTLDTNGTFIGVTPVSFKSLINPMSNSLNNYWNMAVVEGFGPVANSWQLTENFIHNPSGNTVELFNASVNYSAENPRRLTLNLNGTIKGLSDRAKNLVSRNINAKTKFDTGVAPNLYTRGVKFVPSGYTINPIPTLRQVEYVESNGEIRYSYSFMAASGGLISDSIEENINVSDAGSYDVFAQIPIPGRSAGPIFQNMRTVTAPERTVYINAVLTPSTSDLSLSSLSSLYQSKPNTNAIVDALKPNAGFYYVKQDSEEWNPIKRQYSRTTSWILQNNGASISGIPSAPRNNA